MPTPTCVLSSPLVPSSSHSRAAVLGPHRGLSHPHKLPPPSGSGGEAGEEAAVAPEVVRPGPPQRVGPQEADAGRVSGQVRLSTSESSESDEVWVCPVRAGKAADEVAATLARGVL